VSSENPSLEIPQLNFEDIAGTLIHCCAREQMHMMSEFRTV